MLLPVLFWSCQMGVLECTEFVRDLSRDIDITDGQVDQVDKCIHGSKSAGTVLHDPDDSVEALGGRGGQSRVSEGKDIVDMFPGTGSV